MLRAIVCLLCLFPLSAGEVPVHHGTVTLGPDSGHRFVGLGVSASNGGNPDYKDLSAATRNQMADLLWQQANARIIRLWASLPYLIPAEGSFDLSSFERKFLTSGYLAEARAAGCDTVLLAPAGIPAYLRKNPDSQPWENAEIKDDASATRYGEDLADLIVALHTEAGLLIDVTGVQNEPSSAIKFSPVQLKLALAALRSGLQDAGAPYNAIRLIAPENASVDGTCDDYVDALRNEPALWSALDGVAAHSYNMALKPPFAGDWLADGHDFWCTEAGDAVSLPAGAEADFGRLHGCSLAARALNDIRQGCTHWIWFLGYERAADNSGDRHRLMRFRSNDTLEVLPTFHYFQAIGQTLPPDSQVLPLTSDIPLTPWTYGRKGRFYAAAALAADGGLGIALCNYSSELFVDDPDSGFNGKNSGYPAAELALTLDLSALAAGDSAVRIVRIGSGTDPLPVDNAAGWRSETDAQLAADGTLQLTVHPTELVCLQLAAPLRRSVRLLLDPPAAVTIACQPGDRIDEHAPYDFGHLLPVRDHNFELVPRSDGDG